jgi:hypothetical protein
MSNHLLIFLFIILSLWSCDNEEVASNKGNDSIMGSWNFTATDYDSTCTGDGELVAEGTMVFSETDVIVTNNISFNSFCSTSNGTIINDTTCVINGSYENYTITLSYMHGLCEYADMALTDIGCSQISTNSYSFNESLYIMYFTEYDIPDYDCLEIMGSYNESDSSCTYADTVDITINGDNATFNEFYIDYYNPEYTYCTVTELQRQ